MKENKTTNKTLWNITKQGRFTMETEQPSVVIGWVRFKSAFIPELFDLQSMDQSSFGAGVKAHPNQTPNH